MSTWPTGDDTPEPTMSTWPTGDDTPQPATSASEPSTASEPIKRRGRLALTICTIRKPGMSEEEFGDYLLKIHAQLSKGLLHKYGMVRWTMSHNTTQTRSLLPKIYGPGFNNTVPYDCFSQAVFEIDDIDKIVSMTQDPYYKKYIQKDPPNFADMENTKVSIGWLADHIMDGQIMDE